MLQFLPSDLDEATRLLMELVFEPAFPEEEFKKEMGVITEECQSGLDDPMRFFFDQLNWHMFGDQHGHPIVGTLDSIQDMTPEKLHRFVNAHYTPANILISFVGKVDPKEIEKVLQSCLPELPEGEFEPWWKDVLTLDEYHFHHKSKQAVVALSYKGVTLQGEMDHSFLPDVFCNCLGGGMHSILFDRVREKLGICYHVGAYHSSNATSGQLMIYCLLDEKNIDLAIEESRKIISKVKKEGLDSELLDIAKRNYLFNFAKSCLTPGGIASFIENYFEIDPASINDYISFNERAKRVNSITNHNMIEFAREIFDNKKPHAVVKMTQTPEAKEALPAIIIDDKTREEFDVTFD